jgi:hypothetical protein
VAFQLIHRSPANFLFARDSIFLLKTYGMVHRRLFTEALRKFHLLLLYTGSVLQYSESNVSAEANLAFPIEIVQPLPLLFCQFDLNANVSMSTPPVHLRFFCAHGGLPPDRNFGRCGQTISSSGVHPNARPGCSSDFFYLVEFQL